MKDTKRAVIVGEKTFGKGFLSRACWNCSMTAKDCV